MFTIELIPGPLRGLAAEGLGRLIHHLTGLREEIRHGLIHTIGRAISEWVETVLQSAMGHRVPLSPPGESDRFRPRVDSHSEPELEFDDRYATEGDGEDADFEDREHPYSIDIGNGTETPEPIPLAVPPSRSRSTGPRTVSMALATGLTGLATWLGSSGLTPLATIASVLAGSILLVFG